MLLVLGTGMCFNTRFVSELTNDLAAKKNELLKYINKLNEGKQTDSELSK